MPDTKKPVSSVADYYGDLFELNGAVMDQDSYEKHTASCPASAPQPEAAPSEQPAAPVSPFDQPQDFRQIAAQAIEADRQAEYRPETASFVVLQEETGEYVETAEVFRPGEMHMVLGSTQLIRTGSGSYRRSGSYRLSSGSYRLTSGSYRITSGSYRLSSGSYRRSSGSYRRSSGSYRPSSSSYHLISCPRYLPALPIGEQPYTGSLLWSSDLGGYGLGLI